MFSEIGVMGILKKQIFVQTRYLPNTFKYSTVLNRRLIINNMRRCYKWLLKAVLEHIVLAFDIVITKVCV